MIRRAEIEASCRELRVSKLELLGYHDSGIAEWDRVGTLGSFAGSALDEEVARLAKLIDRYLPRWW